MEKKTKIHNPKEQTNTIKIFNLSSYILSEMEINLLSKGLSYCPTTRINEFQLFMDLNKFIRKITLTRHFNIQDHSINYESTSDTNIYLSSPVPDEVKSTSPPPIHTSLKPPLTFYQ